MIAYKSASELLSALQSLEDERAIIDGYVRTRGEVSFFCSVCEQLRRGSIRQPAKGEWIDLRDQVACSVCGHNSRSRLLFELIKKEISGDRPPRTLIFERVTPFYHLLKRIVPNTVGVEFGGTHLGPGDSFISHEIEIRHEDMQALSFDDECFDLVVHSDVLEHVPDPLRGMAEIQRTLRSGGRCVFACPVYTTLEHRQRAYLDSSGALVFTDEPAFHGDPLREEGIPVFYEFGLSLLDDLQRIGFSAEALMYHSFVRGYYSNDNPYPSGLMWPIVFVCTKV